MNTWKVILATLVIFGAGVVTGGLLVKYAANLNVPQNSSKPAPAGGNGRSNGGFQPAANPWQIQSRNLMRRMERDLSLTSGQREHMEQIITESQERTKSLWKPITPQMAREWGRLRRELRDQLTPEQAAKFDAFFKQRQGPGKRRPGTNAPAGDTNSISTNSLADGPGSVQ